MGRDGSRRSHRFGRNEVAEAPWLAHLRAAISAVEGVLQSDQSIMTDLLKDASTILACYERAEAELVGKAVVLSDGKAGTVERIWLDEFHGLRVSIGGHFGKWPVSSLKLIGS
jgi:hypothetical protein